MSRVSNEWAQTTAFEFGALNEAKNYRTALLLLRHFEAGLVRLFDRLIFPLVHGVESHICPPPVGQSLLAVAVAR